MPDRIRRALAPHEGDAAPLPAGVHRIALPTPFAVGRINTYLLVGDPLTLVDCGVNTGVSLDTLEAALESLGYRIEDLEQVILTHEHFDHIGLAEIIARRAGCPVAAFASLQPLFDPDENAGDVVRSRISWGTAQ
ncbi:MAG: MBL fold metallo-hydrolase, partial [Solirubrobacteraceae bacterium]|nr:MBL fold metallo-hydrolase [Solirubrobacteraceae bacterium]